MTGRKVFFIKNVANWVHLSNHQDAGILNKYGIDELKSQVSEILVWRVRQKDNFTGKSH